MPPSAHYAIRGGLEGRERLRLLGRVMRPSSSALFDRLGLADGATCLDAGCGGGDATLELARRVSPRGRVIGIDLDGTKIELAREEAAQAGVRNVSFEQRDIRDVPGPATFDVIYARFLLTHLSDPSAALAAFHQRLRPGGLLAVEDIDFTGHFTYPSSPAFERYHALYCATVTRRGGDPNIGPRLPGLLIETGFQNVSVSVAQPLALQGEAKLLNPLTLEAIAGAVLEDGLADAEEIDRLVAELYAFAADPRTLAGPPRVFQTWGRRPPEPSSAES